MISRRYNIHVIHVAICKFSLMPTRRARWRAWRRREEGDIFTSRCSVAKVSWEGEKQTDGMTERDVGYWFRRSTYTRSTQRHTYFWRCVPEKRSDLARQVPCVPYDDLRPDGVRRLSRCASKSSALASGRSQVKRFLFFSRARVILRREGAL